MKPLLVASALIVASMVATVPSHAHDAYSDAESHPLKIVSYPVAAAGFALQWLLTRPIQFLVSQPTTQPVFNYEPSYNAFDAPQPYLPGRAPGQEALPPGSQVLVPPAP